MKRFALFAMSCLLLCCAASLLASDGVHDVIRLEKAAVSKDVQLAFVQNAKTPFDPTAAEIEELEKAGVTATVIIAMIDRGNALKRENQTSQDAVRPATEAPSDPVLKNVPRFPYPPGSEVEPSTNYADESMEETAVLYAPPSRELNISYFYGSLAPYGSWHQIAGRGYSWRPSVAVSMNSWRPYSNSGHWVWTDNGWYWESDYPWGWAVFHYGRWSEDTEFGWVWSPDTVWGPAWVNWRYSDDYYGWAPLPPEARYDTGIGFSFRDKHVGVDFHFGLNERAYTFVPSNSFLVGDISTVALSRNHITKIYNNTTINNTYIYNDNRIINQGVPVQTVARGTNTRIEAIQVNDMQVTEGQTLARGEVRDQKRIRAYRPSISNEAPLEPKQASTQFQTRMHAAAERSPAKARDRSAASGAGASDAQTRGRSTTTGVTVQSEIQARQRLDTEKSRRGQEGTRPSDTSGRTSGQAAIQPKGNGDNRDDARSGKIDRVGDGNSGQGDDLHKPSGADRGDNGRAGAADKHEAEKANRETDSNARTQKPQAEDQKRNKDSGQRDSEVKAKHEEETKARAPQQPEVQKHPQQAEPKPVEERARRTPEPEAQQQKAQDAPKKPDAATPPTGEDKDHSSGPPEGKGKKNR